ncbi:hypothetical protein K1T73_15450 [Roseovarius sp. SCSIO 43702]|uniref:hypothetical protein n=1 Tax=Roseovarius sp. SCSIO 43702 TaxID=2823043 RepID=UPI001C739D17|nr:hypothetical protein [Roseovarius sp. SCSIO 43702]QYX56429.1 hypothetical protein K1T73_15450 [Roseovarius sp. SCSIO 43702]
MSDPREPHERSSNSTLAFIVGGLVVAVAVIAWIMYGGDAGDDGDINVEVEGGSEAVEDAADSVGDAAQDAADSVGDAAQDAADSVDDAADDAGDAAEDTTNQ